MVVEITSFETEGRDTGIKCKKYETHGVREYWIVDPKRQSVQVLGLGDSGRFDVLDVAKSGDVAASKLLEGFAIDVDGLFAEDLT